jgi:ABC-type antimicrobial peptide transport system permease subunit
MTPLNDDTPRPPRWAAWLLARLHPSETLEEVQGDLEELYAHWRRQDGKSRAAFRYGLAVLSVLPPLVRRRRRKPHYPQPSPFPNAMIRNYFTVARRNLARHRGYSFLNIAGLGAGMAVALLIGLWVWDELSFNTYHQHYDRIAQVWNQTTYKGEVRRGDASPYALADQLRTAYAGDFEHVVLAWWAQEYILAYGDRKFSRRGNFMEAGAPEMLTLRMRQGTRAGLQDPASILLSQSTAEALFGSDDPLNKIVKLNNAQQLKVTGVYEDLPRNSQFWNLAFIAPWDLLVATEGFVKRLRDQADWADHSFQLFVQLAPGADFQSVAAKVRHVKRKHHPEPAVFNPEVFLHPMRDWHLHTGWDKTGAPEGRIRYVWLFGVIGGFVLLLACINFMNLSTARSEKRAREVGIRKAIGSGRMQLVGQFLGESLLMTTIAFLLALLLVQVALPFFNGVADKQITLPWTHPAFWLGCLGFTLLTGVLAGSYPALYLSAFHPARVLKGTFRVGRLASLPRKGLVVVQFAVSVTLIIGTLVVFRQIEYAKDRPIGYDRHGLITVALNTPELRGKYGALRTELLATGAVVDMSTSSAPTTELGYQSGGFEWEGKDPAFRDAHFGVVAVTHDYGNTVGWRFTAGRDFSRQFASDSAGIVLNATAVAYMNLKDPVGQRIKYNGQLYRVLGVTEDMVMESPFEPIKPTVFLLLYEWAGVINIKLNPAMPARASLDKVQAVFRRFNPGSPFEYKFTDQEYAAKFAAEERIGTLATGFAGLAIFISCLGLFGLASFVAERRTKEIGVRKVMGASVFQLWGLLSKEFVVLVVAAFLVAAPVAWYFLRGWLAGYAYRTAMPWWLFAASGAGALLITLLTVSYQSIKAALTNPVHSLRSE